MLLMEPINNTNEFRARDYNEFGDFVCIVGYHCKNITQRLRKFKPNQQHAGGK